MGAWWPGPPHWPPGRDVGPPGRQEDCTLEPHSDESFRDQVTGLFQTHFPRLFRFLDRISGDPAQAQDLAQEAFIRLYRRGELPEAPEAWLISVALNLFRNSRASVRRHHELLTPDRGARIHSDPETAPDSALEQRDTRQAVRAALEGLSERDREMLLLFAEGFSYRDIAAVLGLNEASVGTLLARARRAFQASYEAGHAP